MRISWNCLNQLIDIKDISILDIKEALTLAGFEVENMQYEHLLFDTILDITITANRQDIIGIIHIAIELSAIFKRSTIVNHSFIYNQEHKNIYVIHNIARINDSDNIKDYLSKLHISITNTILDKINYVNLKWGQKFQAYKLNIIKTNLVDQEITIHVNNSPKVYCNNNMLDLLNTESIEEKNISILLINYQKNNMYCSYAYKDLFNILEVKDQQIKIPKVRKKKKTSTKPLNIIKCKIEKITSVLGPIRKNYHLSKLTLDNIITTLELLNFKVKHKSNLLEVKIPQERQNDIYNDVDIIEEIGRIFGFKNFIDQLPYFKNLEKTSSSLRINKKIRQILRSIGLHEVISYSFEGKLDKKKHRIINPLNDEQSFLRNNLLENLIISKTYNVDQKNESFEVFEIGTVFIKNTDKNNYIESKHLCCLIGKKDFNKTTWNNQTSALTWLQAKGQIEDFLERINTKIRWSTKNNNNNFIKSLSKYIHPTKNIYINNNNKTIGIFSQLNYRINSFTDLHNTIYFFEIDIIEMEKMINRKNHLQYRFSPFFNYPTITRDLSIKVKKNIFMEIIFNLIKNFQTKKRDIIKDIKILNEYNNNKDEKTICLRVTYRDINKTLKYTEVEKLNSLLSKELLEIIKSKT